MGIFSFARYGSDFYSSRYEGRVKKPQKVSSSDYSVFDNYYIPEVTSVLLLRSCKVSSLKKSTGVFFCFFFKRSIVQARKAGAVETVYQTAQVEGEKGRPSTCPHTVITTLHQHAFTNKGLKDVQRNYGVASGLGGKWAFFSFKVSFNVVMLF